MAARAGNGKRRRWGAQLAATGLTSKAIAERLQLSVRTVDNYLGRIFTKLGVTRRSELAELLDTGASDPT